jgi:hypothetical protein
MLAIATELAQHDPIYEPMAVKYGTSEHGARHDQQGEGTNRMKIDFYDVIHLHWRKFP